MKLTAKMRSSKDSGFIDSTDSHTLLCKTIKIMKLSAVLLLLSFQIYAGTYSQNVSLSEKNVKLTKVLDAIEKKTGLYFWYDQLLLDKTEPVTISCHNLPWNEVLSSLLHPQGLNFNMENGTIVITRKPLTMPDSLTIAMPIPPLKITGVVKDPDGNPLQGASVRVKGAGFGVVTNAEGFFKLECAEGQVLEVSVIGYKTFTTVIHNNNLIQIVLQPVLNSLTDIVVVGYGTQKKALVSGSLATVKMEEVLGNRAETNMGALLQSSIPGLQVTLSSGAPGANSSFNVRGGTDFGTSATSSINAGGPFILLDNVPFNGSLNLLDPNDIESITVLKDAGSAAIYGARSAFGVILITSKSGKKNQKTQFTYSDHFVSASPENLPKKATPLQTVQSMIDGGMTPTYMGNQNLATWIQLLQTYKTAPQTYPGGYTINSGVFYQLAPTDELKQLLGNSSFQQMHNFTLSGGSDKTTYRMSLGTTNENGILVPAANQDNFKKYNIKSVVSTEVTNWFTAQLDANYYNATTTSPNYTNAFGDAINTPSMLALDSVPGIAGVVSTAKNEIMASAPTINNDQDIRVTGRAIFKPIKGLTITGEYTIDNLINLRTLYNEKASGFINPYTYVSSTIGSGIYTRTNAHSNYQAVNLFATYVKSIGKHTVTLTGGYNQEQYNYQVDSITSSSMLVANLPSISGTTGLVPLQGGDNYDQNSTQGVFGRLNYDFKNKYLFQVNGRYDGSSKFPEGHRWGFFPSASIGWRIMEESFMKSIKPVLNEFKLRGSYGSVGNQNISDYQYFGGLTSYLPNWLVGGAQVGTLNAPPLVSQNFTWETVTTVDYGFDFGMLRNRLTGSLDIYQRDTKNILTTNPTPLPAVLGTGGPLQNAGALRTNGFELQINWKDKIGKVTYWIGANLMDYTTVVTKAINPNNVITGGTLYTGKHMGEIWGYVTDRLFTQNDFVSGSLNTSLRNGTILHGIPVQNGQSPNPGDIKYKAFNGDSTITSGAGTLNNHGDLQVIGNNTPRDQYGITGGVSYKNFSFSFVISGVAKQQQWLNNGMIFPNQWLTYGALQSSQTNYWTPTNLNSYFGRIYTDNVNSPYQAFNQVTQTRFLQNGAYTRLRNVTLGYIFPNTDMLKKAAIKRMQVYITVENPFIWDHMPNGMEPDVSPIGSTAGGGMGYPFLRKTSVGLSVTYYYEKIYIYFNDTDSSCHWV